MIWGYRHFRKPQVDPFDTLVVLVVPCSCSDSLLDAAQGDLGHTAKWLHDSAPLRRIVDDPRQETRRHELRQTMNGKHFKTRSLGFTCCGCHLIDTHAS
jgi:hypothetical protein